MLAWITIKLWKVGNVICVLYFARSRVWGAEWRSCRRVFFGNASAKQILMSSCRPTPWNGESAKPSTPKGSQIPSETISLNQGYTAALSHLIRAQGIEMESSDWGWDSLSQHRKLPRFHLLDCTWSLEGWSARVRETSGRVDTTRAEVPYIVKDARTCFYVDLDVYHMCIVVECGHCFMSSCLQHQYKNKVIQHHWVGF